MVRDRVAARPQQAGCLAAVPHAREDLSRPVTNVDDDPQAARLCERIRRYWELYYATVAASPERVLEVLPSFITGPHRLLVTIASDVVAVAMFPADAFEVECE